MKRILAAFLAALLAVSVFTACGSSKKEQGSKDEAQNEIQDGAENKIVEADNLKFKLNEDGNSYGVVGMIDREAAEVVIPAQVKNKPVTRILENAFYGRTALQTVSFPDTLTAIETNAFFWCSSLTNITLPDSVVEIGYDAFEESGYDNNESNWENGALYLGKHLLEITGWVEEEYSVKDGTISIADQTFGGQYRLEKVELPDSLKGIGANAFYKCQTLTDINFPNNLVYIGKYAFDMCSISKIEIPKSVEKIGEAAFNSSALDEISVSDDNLYYYCEGNCLIEKDTDTLIVGAKKCTIPNGVKHIGKYAFSGCNIHNAVIPESVITIGDYAFAFCDSLYTVEIKGNVTSIGSSAFSSCDSLESINIPDCVTDFGEMVFSSCDNLSYTESNGAKYIGDSANPYVVLMDVEDKKINSFSIHEKTKHIASRAFMDCENLTDVSIPDSIISIGEYAFKQCAQLKEITLPCQIQRIGSQAFSGCDALESIVIPESVEELGGYIFEGCDALANIYCEAENVPQGWHKTWRYECSATVEWGH